MAVETGKNRTACGGFVRDRPTEISFLRKMIGAQTAQNNFVMGFFNLKEGIPHDASTVDCRLRDVNSTI
jgi:hypothetical protein